MLYILLFIAIVLAGYFGVQYSLLKRSLKKVTTELQEVTSELDENQIVKLPSPNKDIELLLETINIMLDKIREEAIEQSRRETELKSQIESISHDLRTPLTSIQGYLSLIDSSRLDDESLEALEVVGRKADSLQRLIVQFYELSQIENENELLDLQLCDIAYLLRETIASHYQLLSESSLEISLEIPEDSVEVFVNPEAIERIFTNLIENASRYALSKIKIGVYTDTELVKIVLSNDCELPRGTDPENLFVPFYVGHSSRPKGSSGLGLSIARRLSVSTNARLEATFNPSSNGRIIDLILSIKK